ncbi:MAG: hypothetical protein QOJ69_1301, partial [Actinomycetota bacterium]|nr:hypothetical protein [Actinomycetota bacterium]
SCKPDGNISNCQVLVARYRSNGLLDPSFGSGGIFTTALPPADGPFNGTAIARQPSTGRLVVAGAYGGDSILLMRLTPSGQLDPTFGPAGNGLVRVFVGGPGNALAIDEHGRIFVGAWNRNPPGAPMVVARFSPDGLLDTRFGQNGTVQLLFWDPNIGASANVATLNVAADGNVTGVGHIDYIGDPSRGGTAGVFQLSSSGKPAPGFGSGGHIEIALMTSPGIFANWFPCAMTVDSRGRIVVTGSVDAGTGPAILNARLTPSGTLDRSYGTAGSGLVLVGGLGNDVGSQTNCGAAVDLSNAVTTGIGATLVQVTSDGTPNTRFGPGGFVTIGAPAGVNLSAVTNAGAGRIVLTGSAGDAGAAMYVARYRTR